MSAIRTEGLCKNYGTVRAVSNLTLAVEPGTIFGFLGPNGAGKTTTIRLLTGMSHPTAGEAWVAGQNVKHNHSVAARIGFLPEEPVLYPWMTPLELLDHVGRIFGQDSAQRRARADELLEQTGLSQVRKRRIGGFSRGMRQRLGLAQAMVNRPEVLFLDEPVSALDPVGRRDVLNMIRGLRNQCTVFMSTHILDDVERVCDTIGIINQGQLVVQADQEELRSRYSAPIFEVECMEGRENALQALAQDLVALAWVVSVARDGPVARVVVRDIDTARQALLPFIAQTGMPVKRYEIVTPSLEDVFLQVIGQPGGTA
jgi:ABC-2 type transport system ATP-binding protein